MAKLTIIQLYRKYSNPKTKMLYNILLDTSCPHISYESGRLEQEAKEAICKFFFSVYYSALFSSHNDTLLEA